MASPNLKIPNTNDSLFNLDPDRYKNIIKQIKQIDNHKYN